MALDVFSLLGVCALGAAWPVLWRPWRTQELPRTTALSPCSRVLWSERPASGKSQFSRMDAYRWEFMSCPVGVNIYTNNVLIILVTDVYELFLCVYLGFLFFFFWCPYRGLTSHRPSTKKWSSGWEKCADCSSSVLRLLHWESVSSTACCPLLRSDKTNPKKTLISVSVI